MAINFHPLPVELFDIKLRPFIKRHNQELRDLFGLEGTLQSATTTTSRSDSTVARRKDQRVDATRVAGLVTPAGVVDADTLDGLDSTQFLRSDVNDNYTNGSLVFNAGTTVNIAGTFQISGTALTATATQLNTVTDGSNADSLHVHTASGVTGFLTTDDTGTSSGQAYTLTNATPLTLSANDPTVNVGSGTSDETLTFDFNATASPDAWGLVLTDAAGGGSHSFSMQYVPLAGGFTMVANTTMGWSTTTGAIAFNSGDDAITLTSGGSGDITLASESGSVTIKQGTSIAFVLNLGSTSYAQDSTVNFLASGNSGAYFWDQDADQFVFSDDLRVPDGEALIVGTGSYGSFTSDGTSPQFTSSAGSFVFGSAGAGIDYEFKLNGETNQGYFRWLEDEDRFQFDDTTEFGAADALYLSNAAPVIQWDVGGLTDTAGTLTFERQTTNPVTSNSTYVFTGANNTGDFRFTVTKAGGATAASTSSFAFNSGSTMTFSAAADDIIFRVASGNAVQFDDNGLGNVAFHAADSGNAYTEIQIPINYATVSAEKASVLIGNTNSLNIDTNVTNERWFNIEAPDLDIDGSITVTTAASFYIGGAPTNSGAGTLSTALAFWIDSGKAQFDGEIEVDGDLNHDGTNVGFYAATPVSQASALTTALTSITHTGPSTPDYAIATPVDSGAGSAWGFSTQDEFETVMSVVLNLQTRINELEAALDSTTGVGLVT